MASAADSEIAPIFRLRATRRCRLCCSPQAPGTGSVLLRTISKTSLSSGMRAPCPSEHGSALRGEPPDGRPADAHDPCRLLRAVAVHVEQDEGGALPRRQAEQEPVDVFSELDLVEWIARGLEEHQPPRGPACGARPHPEAVQRHAE